MATTGINPAELLVDGANWAGKAYLNTAAEGFAAQGVRERRAGAT